MIQPEEILQFWFEEIDKKLWFKKDEGFDREIKNRFEEAISDALDGKLSSWEETARGKLALILLCDQFTRNIYRDTKKAFSGDNYALSVAKKGIANGDDKTLTIDEQAFFYMPFMHSEDRGMQEKSIELFTEHQNRGGNNLKWAKMHKDIIDQFGRYPHRNNILERESTPEEVEFLTKPNSSF